MAAQIGLKIAELQVLDKFGKPFSTDSSNIFFNGVYSMILVSSYMHLKCKVRNMKLLKFKRIKLQFQFI